ncbi:MAG: hypothetical protein ACTSVY_04480 [Candidatus Helarchaeota archaeon]
MPVKNILIFLTNGNLLVSKSYGFKEKNMLILTGLLSAFENLTEDLGEGEIKNIIMHEHQILMEIKDDICFALFIDQEDDPKQGNVVLNLIINSFFTIYKGSKLIEPGRLIEASDFDPYLSILDDLAILKNIFAILESSSKKLSVFDILNLYLKEFNSEISIYDAWKALNMLECKEKIIKSVDDDLITFRKKGEILKKFSFKLKE